MEVKKDSILAGKFGHCVFNKHFYKKIIHTLSPGTLSIIESEHWLFNLRNHWI